MVSASLPWHWELSLCPHSAVLLCPSLQLPGITQGLFAVPLAVLTKCCLCCPGTPELPRTCWLRTLLLLCTHIRLGSFNLLPCSSCSLSPSLLGCLSLLLAVCWVG